MDNKVSETWSTKTPIKGKLIHKNSVNSTIRAKRGSPSKLTSRKRKMKMKYSHTVPKICFPFSLFDFFFKSAFNQRKKSKAAANRSKAMPSKNLSKVTKRSSRSSVAVEQNGKRVNEVVLPSEVLLDDAGVKRVIGNFKFSLLGPKIPKTISQIKILLKKNPELKSQLRGMLGDQLKKKKMKAVRDLLAPEKSSIRHLSGARKNKSITGSGRYLNVSITSRTARLLSTDDSDEWTSDSQNLSEEMVRESKNIHLKHWSGGDKNLSEIMTCECLINPSKELASEIKKNLKKQATFESFETMSYDTKIFSTETIVHNLKVEKDKAAVASQNSVSKKNTDKDATKKASNMGKQKKSVQAKINLKSAKSNPSKVSTTKQKPNVESKKSEKANSEKSTFRWLYEKFFSADSVEKKNLPKIPEEEKTEEKNNVEIEKTQSKISEKESATLIDKKTKEMKEKYKQWLKVAPKDVKDRFQWDDYVKVMSYVNQLKKSSSKKDQETKKVLKVWLKTFSDQINVQPLEEETSKFTLTDCDDKNNCLDTKTKDSCSNVKCCAENCVEKPPNEVSCNEGEDLVARMDAILKELFAINRKSSLDSSLETYLSPRQTTESSTPSGKPKKGYRFGSGIGGGDSPSKIVSFADTQGLKKSIDCVNKVKKLKSRRERNGSNKKTDVGNDSDDECELEEKSADMKCGTIAAFDAATTFDRFPALVTSCLGDTSGLTMDNFTMEQVKELCSTLIDKLQQHCNRVDTFVVKEKPDDVVKEQSFQVFTVHTISHGVTLEGNEEELPLVNEITDNVEITGNPPLELQSSVKQDQKFFSTNSQNILNMLVARQPESEKFVTNKNSREKIDIVECSDHDSGFVSSNMNCSIDDLVKGDTNLNVAPVLISDFKDVSSNGVLSATNALSSEVRNEIEVTGDCTTEVNLDSDEFKTPVTADSSETTESPDVAKSEEKASQVDDGGGGSTDTERPLFADQSVAHLDLFSEVVVSAFTKYSGSPLKGTWPLTGTISGGGQGSKQCPYNNLAQDWRLPSSFVDSPSTSLSCHASSTDLHPPSNSSRRSSEASPLVKATSSFKVAEPHAGELKSSVSSGASGSQKMKEKIKQLFVKAKK